MKVTVWLVLTLTVMTLAEPEEEQPFTMVIPRPTEPAEPAVQVIWKVFWPAVMVPLVMAQR